MRKSLVALSVIFMVYSIWAQSSYKRASSAAMTVHFPPPAIAAFQKIDAERTALMCGSFPTICSKAAELGSAAATSQPNISPRNFLFMV